jgi:hypothetical protein
VAYDDPSFHIRFLTATLSDDGSTACQPASKSSRKPLFASQRKNATRIALAEQPRGREDRAEEESRQIKPHMLNLDKSLILEGEK